MQETHLWMRVRSMGQEDSPRGGNGNPLQSSCLEKPVDRGAWQATVHAVAKNHNAKTRWSMCAHTRTHTHSHTHTRARAHTHTHEWSSRVYALNHSLLLPLQSPLLGGSFPWEVIGFNDTVITTLETSLNYMPTTVPTKHSALHVLSSYWMLSISLRSSSVIIPTLRWMPRIRRTEGRCGAPCVGLTSPRGPPSTTFSWLLHSCSAASQPG